MSISVSLLRRTSYRGRVEVVSRDKESRKSAKDGIVPPRLVCIVSGYIHGGGGRQRAKVSRAEKLGKRIFVKRWQFRRAFLAVSQEKPAGILSSSRQPSPRGQRRGRREVNFSGRFLSTCRDRSAAAMKLNVSLRFLCLPSSSVSSFHPIPRIIPL